MKTQMKSNHFRILAVDDETYILDLYEQILCPSQGPSEPASSTSSFDLTTCEQAENAVETVKAATKSGNPFALMFMDIRLPPGPDGVWAAEQIRNLDPNVGIVFVTGHFDTDLEEIERCIPPSDKLQYLQKPFHFKEIRQIALSMCTRWKTENELGIFQAGLETLVEKRTSELLETNRRLEVEIKKRSRAEEGVRVSEDNFRNMIQGNADGVIIFDENEIVLFVNPAAELIFSRDAKDLIGQPLGYPLVAGETTELDIVRGTESQLVAEMRVVETKWLGAKAFLASLRDITAHSQTRETLRQTLDDLKKAMSGTIRAMAAMAERKDHYTGGHQQRVASLSSAIANEMGFSPIETEGLHLASLIHDIGKISIPSQILAKPSPLTDLEFRMIQGHPHDGYEMLKDVQFAWPIARIVQQHHERMDGSGYPQGLSGEEILVEARILCVADVVEAMASHRPYRPALGIDKALDEISKSRGTLYDANVVDACLKIFNDKGHDFSDQHVMPM